MDPCPFVRLIVGNLALKIPVASKPDHSVIHPTSTPCFCKIKLKHFPIQTAVVPFIQSETHSSAADSQLQPQAACFHLSKSDLDKLVLKKLFGKTLCLKISIYTGRRGTTCGVNAGKLLGRVSVPVNLAGTETKAAVFHNGWISVGRDGASAQFHVSVKAEPDPRYVFQFDGEPECSPQVFQIQGSIRQPVFTCKFSFRSSHGDRGQRSRSLQSDKCMSRSWLGSFGSERERPGKERKGWSITVHDLSGSPVATASMVTPFVASPGSDRVSRSNPGSWLILRPADGTWKPWGRLEAWRERGSTDGLGCKFELIPDASGGMSAAGVVLAETRISNKKGGKLVIDLGKERGKSGRVGHSPAYSPHGSGDHGHLVWPSSMYNGFVMSAKVEGEGKCSKPRVEVGVQHVTCTEDAAAYVALAAALDLSMDACKLFSQKLRKELCQNQEELFG